MNYQDNDEPAFGGDRFADALDLCRLAWDTQKTKARLKQRQKLEKDIAAANTKLAAVEANSAAMIARAQRDVKAIHEAAAQRLEAAESAEQELAQREMKIARLEAAWRYIGEPGDVLSGLRSPEFSPLQKARMAAGREPGRDPDRLFFAAPDAAAPIDALIRRDVGDERSDAQGNAFAPSTLSRSLDHKRKSAA